MKFFASVLLLLNCKLALASGWTDYSLPIDTGYEIVRCNSLDVVLAKTNHNAVLSPRSFPNLGPIIEYSVTPTHIFTRHHGRTLRKLFAGDTLEQADPTQVYFCIIRKSDDLVSGPFDEAAFNKRGEVANLSTIHWRKPYNPLGIKIAIWASIIVFGSILLWLVAHRLRTPKQLEAI